MMQPINVTYFNTCTKKYALSAEICKCEGKRLSDLERKKT